MNSLLEESNRCLNCKVKPCQKACPLGNDIPSFIKFVKEDNLKEAFNVLTQTTVLGAICGRVCPHFKQCKGSCVRGIKSEPISIGELEAYVFDNAFKENYDIKTTNELEGKKVAIIGGGPAGLTCAAFLRMSGADVTIYEKQPKLGGITRYGIPDFRLSREIIDKNIEKILNLGIKAECNKALGKDYNLEDLEKEYDAIYLSFGANVSSKMNIPGENLQGVYGGNELLETNIHPNYEGKNVAVSGGGNVAMDTARTIKRLGAKNVYVIYRRAKEQMPAEELEIEEAEKEGVEFLFKTNIVKILGNEKVEKLECIKTELVEKEGEKRPVPVNIENSNYLLDMDYVVMAVGSKPDGEIVSKTKLEVTQYGNIKVDENYMTSKKGIFAGGDLIGTKSTVAWAARSGRNASEAIKKYLLEE
ncbi:MAG: NAD(P)-dependent oxidoreductase [Clostridium sp.]|jgi:glutamate synthase (NADPH/NADH) small chain|nr:NAD(P)-dependent oxidoreductase [Clostridium sp.]